MVQKVSLLLTFIAISFVSSETEFFKQCSDGSSYNETTLHIKLCADNLEITQDTFKDVPANVTTINFDQVIITSISPDAFNTMKNLYTISFNEGAIQGFPSLELNGSQLSSITFQNVEFSERPVIKSKTLGDLIFFHCNLDKLPILTFLPNLIYLNVSNNSISDIDVNELSAATNIEEIVLSNNKIEKLPKGLFKNLFDLITLTLNNNPLKSLDFELMESLEVLYLKGCSISSINFQLSKSFPVLTELDLSFNRLESIPIDAFDNLKSLEIINLSDNLLVELDDAIFANNSHLDRIVLDNNKFLSLPKFKTDSLFVVSEFSCRNCQLVVATGAFESMTAIETIDLSNNELTNLEGVFNKLVNLQKLDLSNNQIETIEVGTFAKQVHLYHLILSGNKLKQLNPRTFNNELITLDLTNTSIGDNFIWTKSRSTLPDLYRLILKKNQIRKLTVNDLKVTPNVKVIDLDENPIECTDEIYDVIVWLAKKNVAGFDQEDDLILSLNVASQDSQQDDFWKKKYAEYCPNIKRDYTELEKITPIREIIHSIEENLDISPVNDNLYDIQDEEEDEEDEDEDEDEFNNSEIVDQATDSPQIISLPSVSYIISLTSIFVLSAIVVLMIVLSMALIIMRRSAAYESNGPRFRLPQISRIIKPVFQEKYHNHSVYKTLTEEYDEPCQIQYEFGRNNKV